MPWIEGFTNSNRILKSLAKVLCWPRNEDKSIAKDEAWELVYPNPANFEPTVVVKGEILASEDNTVYRVLNQPITDTTSVTVYKNNSIVTTTEYTLDLTTGTIAFSTPNGDTDLITVDYTYNDSGIHNATEAIGTGSDLYNERVILKTTTKPVQTDPQYQGDDTGLGVSFITQYVELYKPFYLMNPETCLNNYKDASGLTKQTSRNQHHIWIRQFDKYEDVVSVSNELLEPSTDMKKFTLKNTAVIEGSLVFKVNGTTTDLTTLGGTFDVTRSEINFSTPPAQRKVIDKQIGQVGDGNNRIFPLSDTNIDTTTLQIKLGSQLTSGYTYNSTTNSITFSSAPGPGVVVTASYTYMAQDIFTADYDYNYSGPLPDVYNSNGQIVTRGASVSEWSKFSWFRDWAEYHIDKLDSDVSTTDIKDGAILQQIEVPNLLDGIPIQYWIRMDKEHICMTIMGEPCIDFNNYLASYTYIGKLESFDGSLNDTAGNFALTAGSSTIPAKIGAAPTQRSAINSVTVLTDTNFTGTLKSDYSYGYVITYFTDSGESPPTRISIGNPGKSTVYMPEDGSGAIKLDFQLPQGSKGYRIYRKDIYRNYENQIKQWEGYTTYKLITSQSTTETIVSFVDDGYTLGSETAPDNSGRPKKSIRRDNLFGGITEIVHPSTWGKDTANGVTDICMFKTRSNAYYQRHRISFTSQDEQMVKVAFNPSRWTEKIHLSPISVVHPFDGYRGMLKDTLIVDSISLAPLDELIVNKGSVDPENPEKTYKYFRVNAPYSIFSVGHGVAIRKK